MATENEAFDQYLAYGKAGYVPYTKLTMVEAIPLLRESGFLPVLAHPMEIGLPLLRL